MNEIDNKELDRLIEDAVFENAARKQLQALENTICRDERKSRMRRRIIWAASGAVSVAAAVVLAVVTLFSPTAEQIQKGIELSERYIASEEIYRDITTSGICTNIQNAVFEMRDGNTEEALSLLKDILKDIDDTEVPNNDDHNVFIDKKNLEYARKTTEWYIALAYMHQGKLSKAKSMLVKIKKSGGYYADDAARMLEEIF